MPTAIGIIALFILVLLLAGVVFGIVLWAGGGRSSGEMSCGGCGYSVRGLETLNCPECGADLRMVGINRGSGGGSRGVGIVLTLFCGGALVLGFFGIFFVSADSQSSAPASIHSMPLQSYPTSPNATTSAQPVLVEDEEGDGVAEPPIDQPTQDAPAPDVAD